MGRYRSRSRSHSPMRSKRYDDPPRRDRRSSPAPTGLLVRNISLHARPEDLRAPFEKFGPIRDVYLPKDYNTGEPRGFGFVKFRSAEDAAEAKEQLNHTVIGGREIRIVYAEENRKTPHEMRRFDRVSTRRSYKRRTPPRSPQRGYQSYSRSPSPVRGDLRNVRATDDYHSSRRARSVSRSVSPRDGKSYKTKQRSPRRSRSVSRSISPRDGRNSKANPRSPMRSRSVSRSLSPPGEKNFRSNRSPNVKVNGQSHDERDHAPKRLQSPRRNTQSPLRRRSRSYSPR